jgi:hypothetical protein
MNVSIATIEALRPGPVDMDSTWADATLAAILADEPDPVRRSRRNPRSRAVLVSLAVAASSVMGAGVAAAATDFVPQSFTDAFAFWKKDPAPGQLGQHSVDPGDARRVATAPGPRGAVFSVISTPGNFACHTAVLESPQSAAEALPSSFVDVTSKWCSGSSRGTEFGAADVSFQNGVAGFVVAAGRAARASVEARDGREYPALLVDGEFWGWFPQDENPTLVGYAPDGSVVGRIHLGTQADGRDRSEPPSPPTVEPAN